MKPETQAFVLIVLAAPTVVLGLVGMARGYRIHLRIWRDNGRHHHETQEDTCP